MLAVRWPGWFRVDYYERSLYIRCNGQRQGQTSGDKAGTGKGIRQGIRGQAEKTMNTNLESITTAPKTGEEEFYANDVSLGYTLKDFWIWNVSDLVSNATRGRLAEFIVAKALGISTDVVRDEWDSIDLKTPAGLKIQVKSSAYLQNGFQKKLSTITFITRKTRTWDAKTGIQSEPGRHADVYVFALLAHKDKATVDPLNVTQWAFYVLPTAVLNERTRSQHSIALKTLEDLSGGALDYFHLAEKINSPKK